MDFTNLPPDSKAFLAPMAGVADRAFREICRDFGAAYTVTEMVSAKGLVMGDRKSREPCRAQHLRRPDQRASAWQRGYHPRADACACDGAGGRQL